MFDSLRSCLVAHSARPRAVADEFTALECDPLPGVERPMSTDPFLFLGSSEARGQVLQIANRQQHMLTFVERERLKGTQNPMFVNRLQLSDHESIVTGLAIRSRRASKIADLVCRDSEWPRLWVVHVLRPSEGCPRGRNVKPDRPGRPFWEATPHAPRLPRHASDRFFAWRSWLIVPLGSSATVISSTIIIMIHIMIIIMLEKDGTGCGFVVRAF